MYKKIFFFITIFFIININLYAACNDKILNKEAKEVTLNMTNKETKEGDMYFLLTISNIKENQAIVVSEDDNNTKVTYKYKDTKEGIIEIKNNYIFEKVTYTIKIYSLDSACQNMKLDTRTISTVKYNKYSKYEVCQGNESFDMCKPFYEGEIPSKEIFNNALEEYNKKKEETFFDKVWGIIKEYGLYVLIPIAIITSGYGVLILYKEWRRKRK